MRGSVAGAALSAGVALLAGAGVPWAVAAGPEPARLLLVTVTKGYHHESIPRLAERIERLGRESGLFGVDTAANDAELGAKTTADGLKAYDGVVFINTTGDLPLASREAFLAWIESGKALVGIHAAADTFHGWPAFITLLGAEFDYHREQAKVRVLIDDPKHPATEGLVAPDRPLRRDLPLQELRPGARPHAALSRPAPEHRRARLLSRRLDAGAGKGPDLLHQPGAPRRGGAGGLVRPAPPRRAFAGRCSADGVVHQQMKPPSTTSAVPVVKADSSEARKR